MRAHGVNNAMALKTSAVWSLVSRRRRSIATRSLQALDVLDKFHGQPNGMFTRRRALRRARSVRGHRALRRGRGDVLARAGAGGARRRAAGRSARADRLQRAPATLSPDMWAHQYDQQANQVLCSRDERWVSNGPESNLFGLEPNFGCCTANMHQGWPKLVASLWMAHARRGPRRGRRTAPARSARVSAAASASRSKNGPTTRFVEDVELVVKPDVLLPFPLQLRIPAWAANATVTAQWRAVDRRDAWRVPQSSASWRPGDRSCCTCR